MVGMAEMDGGSVDLVIADPPYFQGEGVQACEYVHLLLGASDTAVPRFRHTPRLQVRHSHLAQDQRRASVWWQVYARHGVYRVRQGERCATIRHGGDNIN